MATKTKRERLLSLSHFFVPKVAFHIDICRSCVGNLQKLYAASAFAAARPPFVVFGLSSAVYVRHHSACSPAWLILREGAI